MTKEQMLQARELIKQKRYDEARAILQGINHPTAAQWLARLNEIAPPRAGTAAAPSPDEQMKTARALIMQERFDEARALLAHIDHPKAAEWRARLEELAPDPAAAPLSAADQHDTLLERAQNLLLSDKHDDARDILRQLDSPQAAFWLDKTAVNQFRSMENLWLDMYFYAPQLPRGADARAWRCPTCQRAWNQARACPQRGQPSCPAQARSRHIEEPRRLAIVLQALSLGHHEDIEKIIGSADPAVIRHWSEALKFQLRRIQGPDVRRAAIQTAATLLGQMAQPQKAKAEPPPPRSAAQPPGGVRGFFRKLRGDK